MELLFNVLLVGTRYLADHPAVLPPERHQRFRVELDVIHTDPDRLRDELQSRLGATVHRATGQEVDHVRETMRVDVRATMATTVPVGPHASFADPASR